MGDTAKKGRVLIHSPYWHILGGGEKYLLGIARALSSRYRVYLTAPPETVSRASSVYGLDLSGINTLEPGRITASGAISKALLTRGFDLFFYMTDGSLFLPAAKKNYLIIQSSAHLPRPGLMTRLKLLPWRILCYSRFMQEVIGRSLAAGAAALPPAIDAGAFESAPAAKEKMILTVGRFFSSHIHEKNQLFLVRFFLDNLRHFPGWRLAVAGALTESSGVAALEKIKKLARGRPVSVHVNLPFKKLRELYSKSSLYWHAAGFGQDEKSRPEKMEHFGITTVEAMASGSVPLVYAGGGQRDIVLDGENGFLWSTREEFLEKNIRLVQNPALIERLARSARQRAFDFSPGHFARKLYEIIG